MGDFSNLGDNLKRIREEMNLNLSQVSEITGISKAMLSKIERGESTPTITNVWKIANGLHISLQDLAQDKEELCKITDIADMKPLVDVKNKLSVYNIVPFSPLNGVQVLYAIIGPHNEHSDNFTHDSNSKEFCIVFQGNVDVIVAGQTYSLREGCSMEFDPKNEHKYVNTGDTEAKVCFLLI